MPARRAVFAATLALPSLACAQGCFPGRPLRHLASEGDANDMQEVNRMEIETMRELKLRPGG